MLEFPHGIIGASPSAPHGIIGASPSARRRRHRGGGWQREDGQAVVVCPPAWQHVVHSTLGKLQYQSNSLFPFFIRQHPMGAADMPY